MLGLRLVDEAANDLRAPLMLLKARLRYATANWDHLDRLEREGALEGALARAEEVGWALDALQARLEALDETLSAR